MKLASVKTTINRPFSLLLVLLLCSIWITPIASALARQYQTTDTTIKLGMAVAIDTDKSKTSSSSSVNKQASTFVEKSSQEKASQTIGVVVAPSQDGIGLTSAKSSTGYVQVATDGEVEVFVTDLNGEPKSGDLLAPSPLRGILMRAADGAKGVVGAALQDFPSSKAETVQFEVSGNKNDAKVGIVGINLDVKSGVKAGASVNFLQKAGQVLVGRDVGALQVFVALVILVLVVVVEGQLVYASVGEYMSSLGRNPLAQRSLRKGLLNTFILALFLFALGGAAAYGVLKI